MTDGVAILRGKGVPTVWLGSMGHETKGDFIRRVAGLCADKIDEAETHQPRNTLTIEFVFNE